MKSYALIVNPVAGKGRALRRAETLSELLTRSSDQVEVLQTTRRGSGIELAAAAAGRVDRIIAVGGDGTLNEVVEGLMTVGGTSDNRPELGFLPAGTANAAIRAFGISSSPGAIARSLPTAESCPLDVGLVRHAGGERAFVLWFGAGWDAVIIHVINGDRSGPMGVSGLLGQTPNILRAVMRYAQHPIQARVDGVSIGNHSTVVVANVGPIGFAGSVAEAADPCDGQFDVVGFPHITIPRLMRYLLRMQRRRLLRSVDISHTLGGEITLESEGEVPFQLDGEPIGKLPATARIVPGAIRFLKT